MDKTKLVIGALVLGLAGLAITFSMQRDNSRADAERLQQANAELAKPDLPVSVSFHHALLGHSMVADFRAQSDMAVNLDVVDAASHGHRDYRITVGPGRPTHIGPLEHVVFEPGDVLTLSHDGYRPLVAPVP